MCVSLVPNESLIELQEFALSLSAWAVYSAKIWVFEVSEYKKIKVKIF